MNSKQLSNVIKPRARRSPFLLLTVVISISVSLYIFSQFQAREEERQLMSERMQRLRSSNRLPDKLILSQRELEYQKKWVQYLAERDFPWSRLFVALEKSANKQIELLEMVPDKNSRLVIVRGEARDMNTLTEFIEKLSGQTGLTGVHLSHQEKIFRERLETISFEVKAKLL